MKLKITQWGFWWCCRWCL